MYVRNQNCCGSFILLRYVYSATERQLYAKSQFVEIIKRQYRKKLKATLFENTGISVMSGQKIRAREQKNEKLLTRASEATQAR